MSGPQGTDFAFVSVYLFFFVLPLREETEKLMCGGWQSEDRKEHSGKVLSPEQGPGILTSPPPRRGHNRTLSPTGNLLEVKDSRNRQKKNGVQLKQGSGAPFSKNPFLSQRGISIYWISNALLSEKQKYVYNPKADLGAKQQGLKISKPSTVV